MKLVYLFLLVVICTIDISSTIIFCMHLCMHLAEKKKVRDIMNRLEKTKDAKACAAQFEAMLEKLRKSGKKETRVAELNVVFAMMYCGEHDRADAMLADVARTFQDSSIKTDDSIKYGYYHRKIWNDMYTERYAHVPDAVGECQRICESDKKMKRQPILKLQNDNFAVFRKMAEQDWEGAYEAMQRLRSEHDIVKESVLDDHLEFFEIRILGRLGREKESREKAVRLLGHKVLPCIAAKLDAA